MDAMPEHGHRDATTPAEDLTRASAPDHSKSRPLASLEAGVEGHENVATTYLSLLLLPDSDSLACYSDVPPTSPTQSASDITALAVQYDVVLHRIPPTRLRLVLLQALTATSRSPSPPTTA